MQKWWVKLSIIIFGSHGNLYERKSHAELNTYVHVLYIHVHSYTHIHKQTHTHLIHNMICVGVLHLDHNVGMDEMRSDNTREDLCPGGGGGEGGYNNNNFIHTFKAQ